jgi:predicted Zn-dependent protease
MPISSYFPVQLQKAVPQSESPRSLFTRADTASRFLTEPDTQRLFRRIVALAQEGDTSVSIAGTWRGTTRWTRNAIGASADLTDTRVTITRIVRGARGSATTNQIDDESLRLAVRAADQEVMRMSENPDLEFLSGPRAHPAPKLFHESTYGLLADDRSRIVRELIGPAIASNVSAAGYLAARADTLSVYDTKGLASYYGTTAAQYSTTIRDQSGNAVGWAGGDHSDWNRLDAPAISKRAIDKCLAARNPIRIEPGRYTVILEPQAVHDIVRMALSESLMERLSNEKYETLVYNLRRAPRGKLGAAKFGMQLVDERIGFETDPMDPEYGYLPFDNTGIPFRKVAWIDEGILRELAYDPGYALTVLDSATATPYTPAYRMGGGTTSLEAMIAATDRGVLVTRFAGVQVLDRKSVMSTGATSGGTWLIENGKITRPVTNLRFNSSPFFVLNNVEQLGVPQRVFSPGAPAVVPALKVREFSFTSSTDAI